MYHYQDKEITCTKRARLLTLQSENTLLHLLKPLQMSPVILIRNFGNSEIDCKIFINWSSNNDAKSWQFFANNTNFQWLNQTSGDCSSRNFKPCIKILSLARINEYHRLSHWILNTHSSPFCLILQLTPCLGFNVPQSFSKFLRISQVVVVIRRIGN